jgi:hypothetical protein
MILGLLALALASPADLLPSATDVLETLQTQEALTLRAEALATTTFRLHNAAALAMEGGSTCADPRLRSLASRAAAFGAAWRDVLQSARVHQAVLERRAAAPTARPIAPEGQDATIARLRARIERDEIRYLEAAAWQRSMLPKRCIEDLDTAPGLAALDGSEDSSWAVIALGDGVLCPGDLPAHGSVYVLNTPRACVSPAPCACPPALIETGAAVGSPH